VELEVERALGLDGKEQIEKYGIEPSSRRASSGSWK
jgi:isoleucyl-tRNA synthetase